MSVVQKNGVKVETPAAELIEGVDLEKPITTKSTPESGSAAQEIEDSLNALKTLLSTVEKLQKVRQEVGDVKLLLIRMLDGEVMSGEDLEQLKVGVGGLSRLVRAYSDHQTALANAQPARTLLDHILKLSGSNSPAR